MGIRLDWEIETERERVRGAGEDPEAKRRRRRSLVRFVTVVAAFLLIIGGVIGGAALRLRYVDWQIEQLLRDTVDAEIANIRIGDQDGFRGIQRSASDDWIQQQLALFEQYQTWKVQPNTAFTGEIVDLVIDGQRARVVLEEIIDGVRYHVVWFYWRYDDGIDANDTSSASDDGWRHVPPDVTFWGDAAQITRSRVNVRYYTLDEVLAAQTADRLEQWIEFACGAMLGALECDSMPMITVDILPQGDLSIGWADVNSWTLRIPSPYLSRAQADSPFDPTLMLATADALAERLIAQSLSAEPSYPADAYYLRQGMISWLVGQFAGIPTNSFLIESLARQYGDSAVGRLAAFMQPNSSIDLFQVVTERPIAQANLDWRDYLTWRLQLENDLVNRRAELEFYALYDIADAYVRDLAAARFINGTAPAGWVVNSASSTVDTNGVPVLNATAQNNLTGEQQEILFRLTDGVWKRAS